MILLLAIIVLGIGGGLPRLLSGGGSDREPVGLLTPGVQGTNPPAPPQLTPSTDSPGSTSTLSTPPVQTQRPGSAETASASEAAKSWAKIFYARTPSKETYAQLVDRAEQFTTSELAAAFSSAGDPTYDALAAGGGTSKVLSVIVTTPREGVAPVDTPTRVTRFVTVKVGTTGKNASEFDVPLLVTVIPQGNRWLVSAVDGGTGP